MARVLIVQVLDQLGNNLGVSVRFELMACNKSKLLVFIFSLRPENHEEG